MVPVAGPQVRWKLGDAIARTREYGGGARRGKASARRGRLSPRPAPLGYGPFIGLRRARYCVPSGRKPRKGTQ